MPHPMPNPAPGRALARPACLSQPPRPILPPEWRRHACRLADLRLSLAGLALQRALSCRANFNPAQARDPEGRWSGAGSHAPRRKPGTQVASGARAIAALLRLVRGGYAYKGKSFEATGGQAKQAEENALEIERLASRIRDKDPSWEPPASSGDVKTIEDVLSHQNKVLSAAEQHLQKLESSGFGGNAGPKLDPASPAPTLPVPPLTLDSLTTPGGEPVGVVLHPGKPAMRTVSRLEFAQMAFMIRQVAEPLPEDPRFMGQWFRLNDGSIVGLRYSEDNGLTLDIKLIPRLEGYAVTKVHYR